jgi:hypothetical protein
MKYRIVRHDWEAREIAPGCKCEARTVYEIQSFTHGDWRLDMRTWDPNHCGYISSYTEALKRFNELVYPKKPTVILEAETND